MQHLRRHSFVPQLVPCSAPWGNLAVSGRHLGIQDGRQPEIVILNVSGRVAILKSKMAATFPSVAQRLARTILPFQDGGSTGSCYTS